MGVSWLEGQMRPPQAGGAWDRGGSPEGGLRGLWGSHAGLVLLV